MVLRAFDLGITHFDLANNYGPPYGAAEQTFGRVLARDLRRYRDELIVSTKAGYDMWPGPYGDRGSRKYLLASLDQSLGRLGLDYVDIFYSHRVDVDTPLEETMGALDSAVRAGKALYVRSRATRQPDRGRRTDPARAGHAGDHPPGLLLAGQSLDRGRAAGRPGQRGVGLHRLLDARPGAAIRALPRRRAGELACCARRVVQWRHAERGKPRTHSRSRRRRPCAGTDASPDGGRVDAARPRVVSALVGASSVAQLEQTVGALERLDFSDEELAEIDRHATDGNVNLWQPPTGAPGQR